MRIAAAEALARLTAYDHGILCTVHPTRGADAVPVVYALEYELVGVPVDTVKPKTSSLLQRERNLSADPRATLLIEHWDRDDWTRLWWVRASLRWEPEADTTGLATRLAAAFPQYRERPFRRVLPLRLTAVTGWTSGADFASAPQDPLRPLDP